MTLDTILANPIMLIVGVLGLLFLILGLTKQGKTKTAGKTFLWIGGISLILVGAGAYTSFNIFQGLPTLSTESGGVTEPGQELPGVDESSICPPGGKVEDTTVTLSALDGGTGVAVGGNHKVKIGSSAAIRIADAGTFTASPGDILNILYGDNQTSATTQAYFSELRTVQVPCDGTFNPADDQEVRLYRNGTTFTMKIFDTNNDQLTNNTKNQTFNAGDVKTMKVEIQGENQRGFPYGALLTLELNKTAFDEEKTVFEWEGSIIKATPTPNLHSIASTEDTTLTFELPSFIGPSTHIGSLTLYADTNKDPTTGSTYDSTAKIPSLTFRPKNYFFDERGGNVFSGPDVQDEDNVATYQMAPITKIYID